MLLAIERELETLAARTASDVLAVTDTSGTVIAVGGRRAADWPLQGKVSARYDATGAAHVSMASGVFQFASAPLSLQQQPLGTLQLARALDARYAQELATLSDTATLIVSSDAVVASTLPADLIKDLTPAVLRALPTRNAVRLGSSEYAVKQLFRDDGTAVYALDSIDASTREPMRKALGAVFLIGDRRLCARGIRQRVAGADDLAADRHALEVALGDDGIARLRTSGAGPRAFRSKSTRSRPRSTR